MPDSHQRETVTPFTEVEPQAQVPESRDAPVPALVKEEEEEEEYGGERFEEHSEGQRVAGGAEGAEAGSAAGADGEGAEKGAEAGSGGDDYEDDFEGAGGHGEAEDAKRRQEMAAVKIQSLARGRQGRKRAAARRHEVVARKREVAAVKIQSLARGRQGRKRAARRQQELLDARAATAVQAAAAGHLVRKKTEAQRSAKAVDAVDDAVGEDGPMGGGVEAIGMSSAVIGDAAVKELLSEGAEAVDVEGFGDPSAGELGDVAEVGDVVEAGDVGTLPSRDGSGVDGGASDEYAEDFEEHGETGGEGPEESGGAQGGEGEGGVSRQEMAAVKIQSLARGRQGRKRVARLREERAKATGASSAVGQAGPGEVGQEATEATGGAEDDAPAAPAAQAGADGDALPATVSEARAWMKRAQGTLLSGDLPIALRDASACVRGAAAMGGEDDEALDVMVEAMNAMRDWVLSAFDEGGASHAALLCHRAGITAPAELLAESGGADGLIGRVVVTGGVRLPAEEDLSLTSTIVIGEEPPVALPGGLPHELNVVEIPVSVN